MEAHGKYQELWQMIFYLTESLRDSAAEMNEKTLADKFKDMTYRQSKVFRTLLYMIEGEPEGVTLKAVSQKLGISAAAASEMIDCMVQKGIFERSQSQSDRRAICINISEQMKLELKRVNAFFGERAKVMTSVLSEEELSTFMEVMRKLYITTKQREDVKC